MSLQPGNENEIRVFRWKSVEIAHNTPYLRGLNSKRSTLIKLLLNQNNIGIAQVSLVVLIYLESHSQWQPNIYHCFILPLPTTIRWNFFGRVQVILIDRLRATKGIYNGAGNQCSIMYSFRKEIQNQRLTNKNTVNYSWKSDWTNQKRLLSWLCKKVSPQLVHEMLAQS